VIKRRNHGGGHSYWEVDETTGDETKVPGVTSLLSDGLPKGGLKNWAAEQAAQHAIMHWDELSRLGLLERAKEIQFAWQRERDAAAGKGQKIHQLAQRAVAGQRVEIPEGLEGHVESCVKFLDDYQVQEIVTETTVVNRAIPYAGTLDLVGRMLGHVWLCDWKTGKNAYSDTALQLAAYAHAEHYVGPDGLEHPMSELGIERGAVVHLRPDGYDVYPMNIGDLTFNLFRHVALVGRWTAWDKDTRSTRMDGLMGRPLQRPTSSTAAAS
jgi:hypothetical protein